jgi:hypothetical protein
MVDDQTGAEPGPDRPQPEPRWCLVGNVVAERLYGEDGELRRGAKLFPGGTKVYYRSAYWGMGAESVTVLGLSRRPRRWITATVASQLIENWRAQLIHAPRVLQELQDDDILDEGEARAKAEVMNRISASDGRRLLARAPQEWDRAARDAGAVLVPGDATDHPDPDQALILYQGTRAVAGLVHAAAPAAPGARRTTPFPWRRLWFRDAEAAASLLEALRSRFPGHDLGTLDAELAPHP